MANNNNLPAVRNIIQSDAVQNSIKARLGEKAGTFTTSLLDVIGEDLSLAKCDPKLVVKQALKAAALDLPINKNLGFAYVIAYKNKGVYEPSFQMGWKGYLQLAIRTGQYKHLNAGAIYEGEIMIIDRIKGTLAIGGNKTSEKAIGYFCYMELINGFEKAIAWTREKVVAHAERFSKSYKKDFSPWKTDFDAMAFKTMVLQLIPKYGPLTIEMSTAMTSDRADFKGFDNQVSEEIEDNANSEIIDITADEPVGEDGMTESEKAKILAEEAAAAQAENQGPGF